MTYFAFVGQRVGPERHSREENRTLDLAPTFFFYCFSGFFKDDLNMEKKTKPRTLLPNEN